MAGLVPDITNEVIKALRAYSQESQWRAQAPDADLRVGRVSVSTVIAIDLADLAADQDEDRRKLHALRANHQVYQCLLKAFEGAHNSGPDIQDRMTDAVGKGGKRVWTDHFVDRFAPLELTIPTGIDHGGRLVLPGQRWWTQTNDSALHFVKLSGTKLRMFRDGTLCYTLEAEIVPNRTGEQGHRPVKVASIIEQLDGINAVAHDEFRRRIRAFLENKQQREALKGHLQGFTLRSNSPDEKDLSRRAKWHTVVFVEQFYDGERVDELYIDRDYDGARDTDAVVPLHAVLASSALAGLLNTARWYQHYNSRYVAKLTRKEIGYRDDEIYLTDRKATVASNIKFWDPEDSLSEYRHEIVLAVEYNVARLAYLAATLSYYQDHPDLHTIERDDPGAALPNVLNGRTILTQLEESLDLTMLIDHGFTRLFVDRLRQELGFPAALGYIRQRIEDASTSVGLKSSVVAAERTSRRTLRAGLAAVAVGAVALVLSAFFGYRTVHDPVKLPERTCIEQQGGQQVLVADCPGPSRPQAVSKP